MVIFVVYQFVRFFFGLNRNLLKKPNMMDYDGNILMVSLLGWSNSIEAWYTFMVLLFK